MVMTPHGYRKGILILKSFYNGLLPKVCRRLILIFTHQGYAKNPTSEMVDQGFRK
jgi:hypothetical protein